MPAWRIFLKKTGLPVVTFGFGCQAALGQSLADAEVDSRSVRLLRVIADLSQSIAVRGAYTADLCRKYGVTNVELIGCQSAYVAGIANWGASAKGPYPPKKRLSAMCPSDRMKRHVLNLMMQAGCDIIGQGNPLEQAIAAQALSAADLVSGQSRLWNMAHGAKTNRHRS